VADSAANSIICYPFNVGLIDSALVDKVLNKPADRVVGQRCYDRRIKAKASLQAAGDVILTAALPCLKGPRGRYSALARIEPEHDLAETQKIPPGIFLWFHDQSGHKDTD